MVKKALPKKKVKKAPPPRIILMFGSSKEVGNLPEKVHAKFKEMHKADRRFIVISGCAMGVDTMCEFYAHKYGHKFIPFKAKWRDKQGNLDLQAGFDRNTVMVNKCTEGVGFWNGKSNGTKDTINKLKKSGKPYEVIKSDEPSLTKTPAYRDNLTKR